MKKSEIPKGKPKIIKPRIVYRRRYKKEKKNREEFIPAWKNGYYNVFDFDTVNEAKYAKGVDSYNALTQQIDKYEITYKLIEENVTNKI